MTQRKEKNYQKNWLASTQAIHVGGEPDPATGAIMPPIFQTSTYVQTNPGEHLGYEYTRSHNPTRSRLEECLAALEHAKYCLVTASGMSMVDLILHMLKPGSLVFSSNDVYGGTNRLFRKVYGHTHNFQFLDPVETEAFCAKIKAEKPDLVWLESPTNPMLKLADIKKISKVTKSIGATLLVDNTFMSPIFQNPLDLGADIVLHSLTKYINGHSDVVGGAMMTNSKKLYDKIWFLQNSVGPSHSPFDSWLVLRGVKTLSVRMKAHEANAKKVAKYLEGHKNVERVIYPGLKSHPQHALAKKQMHGFGGMLTFFLKGKLPQVKKFMKKLNVFALAESLGGVESLVDHPAIMTHASVPIEQRKELGISDNLIRLSVGIEDVDDLIKDLENALK